jgi:hypothetical protein
MGAANKTGSVIETPRGARGETMKTQIELSEDDITEAIAYWLKGTRGLVVKGKADLTYTPGDRPFDADAITASVEAEPLVGAREVARTPAKNSQPHDGDCG